MPLHSGHVSLSFNRDGITAKMVEQCGHMAIISSSPNSELSIIFVPSNQALNDVLLSGLILLVDEIPRSTYNAPTIVEGPIIMIRKPSNMKQIPNDPREIVQMNIPGLFRSRSNTAPMIEIGSDMSPNIIGNIKNTVLSYGKLTITRSCTIASITSRKDTCRVTETMPRLIFSCLHGSDALMNHSAIGSHGRRHWRQPT